MLSPELQDGAIETQLRAVAARMQAHAEGATDLDLLDQQKLRLALAHVVRRSRDVHMIAAHTVFDVDLVAEGVGRELVRRLTPTPGGSS